jgi:hypothetical protein
MRAKRGGLEKQGQNLRRVKNERSSRSTGTASKATEETILKHKLLS